MIEYDFLALINKYQQLYSDAFYQRICPDNITLSDETIDCLWSRIKETSKEIFDHDMSEMLDCIKEDVLLSLYASIYYTTTQGIPQRDIITYLSEKDPALKNTESATSEKQGLSHRRDNLRDSYQPGGNNVLLSGQLFSNNALLYFQPFWENTQAALKCFDLHDYIRYIKASYHWPFSWQHMNGMSFWNYFNGIRKMYNEKYLDGSTPATFDVEFSFYILEQLFSPISFIDNLLLHQEIVSDFFEDYKNPSRERSMVLLRPLFCMPYPLWNMFSENYKKSLKDYINNPNDIYNIINLKANMEISIYYKQCILPLLKIMAGNYLYKACNSNLVEIKELLLSYLSKSENLPPYREAFQERMERLADAAYPKRKIALDLMGNYYLQDRKYQSLDNENRKKQSPPKKPKGNDSKRNNNSVLTYEINFTHQFFGRPEPLDFFVYLNQSFYGNLPSYLSGQIGTYMFEAAQILHGFSTANLLQKQAADSKVFIAGEVQE